MNMHKYLNRLAGVVVLAALLGAPLATQAQEAGTAPAAAEEPFLKINFRGVPLDTVLDYLSKEAGFIIVREAEINGNVDVWSHQPLNKDEAVDLLNTILHHKGYAAIRNGRTLVIVNREDAAQGLLKVIVESDPERMENTDEMVTQIIPVRYTNAAKLLENLEPLLASYSVVSANQDSNAIVLTDTKANVKRMAEIIRALDTTISGISTIKVFLLKYSDAAQTARLITQLFGANAGARGRGRAALTASDQVFSQRGGGGDRGGDRGGFGGGGGFDRNSILERLERLRGGGNSGRGGSGASSSSQAQNAATQVLAVADERTNAVVVSAPDDLMPAIEEVVNQIDTLSIEPREVRVFTLRYSNADEMAGVILDTFDTSRQAGRGGQSSTTPRFFSAFGGGRGGDAGRGGGRTGNSEEEGMVMAVADVRTNSVIVSAISEVMRQIEHVVRELDSNNAREQKVYIYDLENADAEMVSQILNDMFDEQSQRGTSGSSTRRGTTGRSTGGTTGRPTGGAGGAGGAGGRTTGGR